MSVEGTVFKKISLSIFGSFVADFDTLRAVSRIIARKRNPDTQLIGWYDRNLNRCSPRGVDTCDDICMPEGREPGWEKYAKTHGGDLKIDINNGDYVFIYR